jgi:hypothetical protein
MIFLKSAMQNWRPKNPYTKEKEKHKLTFKTTFPNNLERQKGFLADNIFHDSTIAVLKEFVNEDTSGFLEWIRRGT